MKIDQKLRLIRKRALFTIHSARIQLIDPRMRMFPVLVETDVDTPEVKILNLNKKTFIVHSNSTLVSVSENYPEMKRIPDGHLFVLSEQIRFTDQTDPLLIYAHELIKETQWKSI